MKKFLLFVSIFSILLITTSLLLILPVSAADVIHSGTIDNVSWTLNETTGELIISGTGDIPEMDRFYLGEWSVYRDSIKTVKIEEGITSIGAYAFRNCRYLKSITIPNSVTIIEMEAFCGNQSLTSVTFGENSSLRGIGVSAFAYCKKLSHFTIPNSVISIGREAFRGDAFEKIVIPVSVTNIGSNVFLNCDELKAVYYHGTLEQWGKVRVHDENENLINAVTLHNWDDGVITLEPTAEADGVKTFTCECGETRTEAIAKLPATEKDENIDPDSGCDSILSSGIGMMALIVLTGTMIVSKKRQSSNF